MTGPGPRPGEDPVRWLLHTSHNLPPAEVPNAVESACRVLGASVAVVYLVDYGQQMLIPLTQPGGAARRPITVDGTTAGEAFRRVEVRRAPLTDLPDLVAGPAPLPGGATPSADAGDTVLFVPVLDGADRLGVLAVASLDDHPPDVRELEAVATIAAALVVSKSHYTDTIGVTRGQDALDVAAEMRWTFLPPLTYTGPGITVAGMLEPAYEIAGDCFDYAVNGDMVHLAIFDAMGHGLEASRMSNLTVASYRQCRRQGLDFAQTYTVTDAVLTEQFGGFRFVTALLASLSLLDGRVELLAAGHPPPLILGRNGVRDVEYSPCQPIGLGDAPAPVAKTTLEPGDTLVLYSDGVPESRNPAGEMFGLDRLARVLMEGRGEPAAETARRVVREVMEHEAAALRDDATILLAEWHGPGLDPEPGSG